jgi:hypothetical protein
MKNPYTLLRILLGIDIFICVIGAIIPIFKDTNLFELVSAIQYLNGAELVNHILWLLSILVMFVSWIGIFLIRDWGRKLYLLPMVLIFAMSFIRGNSGYNGGIYAVMQDVINLYYGFFICMMYFGPVSHIFKKSA